MSGIFINKTLRRAVIRVTANTTITLANLAATATENVVSASIAQVFWAAGANCTIARGANTICTFPGTTAGHHNYMGHGIALTEFNAANIVFTIPDSNSFMVVEIGKTSYDSNAQMW